MKRLALLAVPLLLFALFVAFRPAEGQDNLQERVSALETQVAVLEAQMAVAEPTATPDVASGHTISGSIVLTGSIGFVDHTIDASASSCSAAGSYSDIATGADVVVRDGARTTIALGSVDTGEWHRISGNTGTCAIPFSVSAVPNADFYSIAIGARQPLLISRGDLEASNWTLVLSLGND